MTRRSKSIFEGLVELPWWASIVVAAVVYVATRWIVPALTPTTSVAGKLIHDVALVAGPYAALLFLIPAPFAAFRTRRRGELLDGARDSQFIRSIPWHEFEALVATAYRRIGYDVEERGGGGADGGVDMVLRAEGKTTLVQCKHWNRQQIGVTIVRELAGVVATERADGGIIVTGGAFTPEAETFAGKAGIELINGRKLEQLLSYARGEAPAASAPAAMAQINPPICPKCALPMVMRTAKRGATAGGQFWGCSRYPACTGTRPAEPAITASP